MRSEDDLIRTLRTAADQAGQPVTGLAGAVASRRRTRRVRQRVQVALAAAAVVVVAGGTTAVLTDTGGRAEPAVTVTTGPPRDERPQVQVKRAAEVWPDAVFKMPAKSADGWKYRPVTGLSATEVLLAAESSFEKAGRLEVFDASTGKTRVVGDMPAPEGVKGYFAQAVDVGERHFAWYGATPNNPDDKWADFWIMPREGGTARRVGEVTGEPSRVEKIGVTDDSLIWSVQKGGVYRMPLTGGAPERINGTDGLHLVSWPLAVAYAPGGRGLRNQSRVVDLETGTSADVQAETGTTNLTCSAEWCFGVRGDRTIRQRLDGSDSEILPEGMSFFGGGRILGDRFALLDAPTGDPAKHYFASAVVYDPVTGLVGGISRVHPAGGGGFGTGTSSSPTTIVYWDEDEKSEETCGTTEPTMTADVVGISRQDGQVCVTRRKGGGKELTVLNLLAVTAGSG